MENDDKLRSNIGLSVCLRDMGEGTSRIFIDDVVSEKLENPIQWNYKNFYTFTPELKNKELDEMNLSDEDFKAIGEVIVVRLLALTGRLK